MKKSKDERVERVLAHWRKLFRENVGETYSPVWGRDQKIIAKLLESYEEEKIIALLDKYYEREHKIYSLIRFVCEANDLIQEERKEKPRKQLENPDAWRFL